MADEPLRPQAKGADNPPIPRGKPAQSAVEGSWKKETSQQEVLQPQPPQQTTSQPVPLVPSQSPDATPYSSSKLYEEFVGSDLRDEFEKRFKSKKWRAVDAVNNPETSPSKRRALVVTIGYGKRRPPTELLGTYVDGYRITRMLAEDFNYADKDICVLADIAIPDSDDEDIDIQPESRWPSKNNIIKGLRWLTEYSEPGDSGHGEYRFLFFAGHGYRQLAKDPITGRIFPNRGILPQDICFQSFEPCDGCVCGDSRLEGPSKPGTTVKTYLIPEPSTMLWGNYINMILAKRLRRGTKLTMIFDCCHSGGTLGSAMYNGVNVTRRKDARTVAQGQSIENADSFLLEMSLWPEEDTLDVPGNLLGLPNETNLSDSTLSSSQVPSVPQERKASAFACQRLSAAKVKESENLLHKECEVMCWAGCTDVQLAHETDGEGGRFTKAFTDYITKHSLEGARTYQFLNRYVQNEFDRDNPKYEGKLQYPKLFTSAGVAKRKGYFQQALDL